MSPSPHELVIDCKGQPYRPLFVFEANGSEQAVILVAGTKKGDDRYYDRMTQQAERELQSFRSDE